MQKVIPDSCCSWNFQIEDETQVVAEIEFDWDPEWTDIRIHGELYQVSSNAPSGGSYQLMRDSRSIALAIKRGILRTFDVEAAGRRFNLSALNLFGRTIGLRENSQLLGTLRPIGIWRCTADVDFPDDIPLNVRVFMIWLALMIWSQRVF
ncbi:MAG: hypothetical protein H8E37_11090 [Planctomycetes bacterium]|nr:hypothetical protein [Planctomycetota bacterium]